MFKLAALVYSLTGPVLAGILIIAVLAMGMDTLRPILVAAGIGFVGGLPLAWIIAGRLRAPKR
jgi:hypothetical protein